MSKVSDILKRKKKGQSKARGVKSADLVSSTNIPTCFVTCSQSFNLSELHVPALQNVNTLKKKNSVPLLIIAVRRGICFSTYKILSKCSL